MIYLFNQLEELIDVIDEASLAEFTHTIELNQFDRSSFEIPVDYKPGIIKEAQFFGFQSRDWAFCLFRISEKSYDISLTIEGIDRAESDLHSFIIEDKRPSGTADQVLRGILEGTGYQLGDTNRLTVSGKMSFYYISVRQALVKIIESYGCEFQVRYTFVENKIIGRYIDVYQRFGRKTGHQFEYGSNILNVTYEESSDEVITALIGRGKGEQNTDDNGEATGGYGRRIQFKDVVWAVAKGDPVDKPAGQNYVANEAARNNYGLHQNGVIKHRFGVYTNENIEDPVELLKATYKELQRLSVPIATFKANLLDLANAIEQDIWIGDSIGIVRDQIGIAFEARIHKLVIDKLDDNRSVVELGDYQTLQAKDRTTRQQAIIDAVSGFSESLIEKAIADEVERRDKEFDEKMRISKLEFDNALESVKAKAEEVKQELSGNINQRFSSFDNGPLQEAKRRAEEALRNAGASSLLAQEAKRIGLDSVAKLEEFKRQATSAQTALSGDLDALKRTIANDIRPKQAQAETEIAKQVEALVQTKKELAGVKSAQATYEETTTRRLSELTNLANGKASKSELTQTAEELTSKIASVHLGRRNLLKGTKELARHKPASEYNGFKVIRTVAGATGYRDSYTERTVISTTGTEYIAIFYARASENDYPIRCHFYNPNTVTLSENSSGYMSKWSDGLSVIRLTTDWQLCWVKWTQIATDQAKTVIIGRHGPQVGGKEGAWIEICAPALFEGNIVSDWSPAYEDQDERVSAVESSFKQRADSLEAGVSRLTEGLRTKADISSLNVTAENIRQSVKSLETDTQNKLNQMLSLAEFEVRAGSIRQEILNATKEKADKTLVVAEAGKLREEFSSLRVGGRNFIRNYDWNRLLPLNGAGPSWEFERVEDQFAKSGYMLKATCTKNGNGGFHKVFFDLRAAEFQGKDMTWSWDIKSSRPITFYAMGFEAGGLNRNVPVSTEWERISNTFKVAFKQYYSCVFYANGWEVGDVVYIRDPQLEEGTIATSPKPAPEDTDGLITEAKAIFERTAQGLQTGLSAIQEYVNKDGQRQEALQRYTREESAKQATAVRELVTRDYVGKATYQEDVKGINQRIEAVKTSANKDIASQIASYRQSVDGKFTDISSQITTYKQDLGGQISGLSNRITSSEQGTTTQISNLSNRINSNKQGTDNQISNLKTQVATNKDNAERQMGRISDQVSANKANADSQFANVTNQLARKVETTDFQRVKETSQLYERILGNTENGIADKVARMAMTNQLFQVEVSKASAGGRNLFLNSLFKYDLHQRYSTYHVNDSVEQTQGQLALSIDSNTKFRGANTLKIVSTFNGKPNNQKVTFRTGGDMRLNTADEMRNKSVRFSFWAKSTVNNTNFQARAGNRNAVEGVSLTTDWKFYDIQLTKSENSNASNEVIMHVFTAATVWIAFPKVEIGTVSTPFSEAPEDTDEAIRTVQSQLSGSWAVQNLTSAGSIVSQINATNNQILIEAEKIRLKGKTLLDELTAIQGYFKRLFVGEGTFATLNADVIRTNSITADKLVMDMAMARRFVSSDLFTDTLAAKEAFINKLRSVVVTATLLEGYRGRIGGFTLGQFDQGGGRWISGVNQFSVGMGNGAGDGVRTAFWANWGNNWNYAGPKAWNVNTDGKMYCRNEVGFYDQVDFSNSSSAQFYGSTYFRYSPRFTSGIHMYDQDILGNGGSPRNSGQNAVVWWNQVGSGSVKYWMDQKSDRRLKENITDTAVKALDKINRLRMVAFDFIESKKHEEIGLIAQEVETIVPRIVSRDPENPDGYLHIDYTALVPYLIKAIQELNQKIEKMEKTIA